MTTEEMVLQKIREANDGGRTNTFAEFIASVFKDRFVEIYLGDAYEEISTEQVSTEYPAVFCGKVVGAYNTCLVVNSVFIDGSDQKEPKFRLGNVVFINERAIRALSEVDGRGTLEDMFLKSKETLGIKLLANKIKAH
jgi:hypothetical protein